VIHYTSIIKDQTSSVCVATQEDSELVLTPRFSYDLGHLDICDDATRDCSSPNFDYNCDSDLECQNPELTQTPGSDKTWKETGFARQFGQDYSTTAMFHSNGSVQCLISSPLCSLTPRNLTPITRLSKSLHKTSLATGPKRLLDDHEYDHPVCKRPRLDFSSFIGNKCTDGFVQNCAETHGADGILSIDQENIVHRNIFHTPQPKSKTQGAPRSFYSCREKRKVLGDIGNITRKSLFSYPKEKPCMETTQCLGTDLERAPTVELDTSHSDCGAAPHEKVPELDFNSRDSGFEGSGAECDSSVDHAETASVSPVPFSFRDINESDDLSDLSFSAFSSKKLELYTGDKMSSDFSTGNVQIQKVSSSSETRQKSKKVSRRLLTLSRDEKPSSNDYDDVVIGDLCSMIDDESEASNCSMDALFSRPVKIGSKVLSEKMERSSSTKTGPLICDNARPKTTLPSCRLDRAKSIVLASDLDFSPCSASNNKIIKRGAISLFGATTSVESVSSNAGQGFKRPVPPSESPYAIEKKKLKYMALASTPTFSTIAKKHHAKSPLPMNLSDSSCDEESDVFMSLTPIEAKQSPKDSDLLASDIEASPDLFKPVALERTHSSIGMLRKNSEPSSLSVRKVALQRSMSESQVTVMKALSKSHDSNEKLTGDFKNCVSLPVLGYGRHPELPSITPETLKDLINGRYSDCVDTYEILDCRYPYEHEGGHIKGAQNWHTVKFVMDRISEVRGCTPQPTDPTKRRIMIFHCEFSAERAPRNQRLLRQEDRSLNSESYPDLHFPELYLLEGGYKAFFEKFPEYCTPMSYVRMADPEYGEQMKACRARGKGLVEENKLSKSRSGFYGRRTALRRL